MSYALDWVGLLVRWLHVITGAAWIGASFYFVWLDNHLQSVAGKVGIEPGVAGELWAVHGGGFYRSQKYRVAPLQLPPTLHWFYWEAYSTWLSGFGLLCLLYFFRADAYLIDAAVLPLTPRAAVAIALALLLATWLLYDGLCRSALGAKPRALTLAVAALVTILAWGLCHVFSGRGAFMLFGSALGTLMVANVRFVIIPGQRELVHAKLEGREPDAAPGLRGKQRSVHNTYFTLPVLFVMVSNHSALTYGANHNWVVLLAFSLAGACIRAWFVARHDPALRGGYKAALPAAASVSTLLAVLWVLAPALPAADARTAALSHDPARVQLIIRMRCAPCHAATPSQPGFNAPPNGLAFESTAQVAAHLSEVRQQVFLRTMPLGNLTHMTDEERVTVLQWIAAQGREKSP